LDVLFLFLKLLPNPDLELKFVVQN
jgi:hypothetical protein